MRSNHVVRLVRVGEPATIEAFYSSSPSAVVRPDEPCDLVVLQKDDAEERELGRRTYPDHREALQSAVSFLHEVAP